eukprot:gene25290-31728_t
MIIPSRWVRKWLLFCHLKVGEPPGPIDMWSLLKQDPNAEGGTGWRAKNTLLPPSTKFGEERPGHYRRISLEAWINLVELYNVDGYALAVRGTPYDDLTRWRVFTNPKIIDIVSFLQYVSVCRLSTSNARTHGLCYVQNLLPEPILFVEEKKEEPSLAGGVKNAAAAVTGALGSLFGMGGKKEEPAAAATTASKATPAAAAKTDSKNSDKVFSGGMNNPSTFNGFIFVN